jgi:hypothetical protein
MSLRQSENGPYLADFRPERNPVPWPGCCLASWSAERTLSFEHFGEGYSSVFEIGEDEARRAAADPGARFALLFGSFADALSGRQPLEKEGHYARGHRQILYRSVLLPFVDLRGSPAYVLGAFTSTPVVSPASARTHPRMSG